MSFEAGLCIFAGKAFILKKKILLINKSGLSTPFEQALKTEGFEVVSFFHVPMPVFKKNLFHKIVNIIRRKLYKDTSYFQNLQKKTDIKNYIKRSKELASEKFDYTLFFRADLYPEQVIKTLKSISERMITVQYDGMEVCGKILDYLHYFDRSFLFDPDDFRKYKQYGFLPITNCWFPDAGKTMPVTQDFFYVGVGTDDRRSKIKQFQNAAAKKFSIKAVLTVPPFRQEEEFGGVRFTHKGLSYKENLMSVKSSRCLIDFKLSYHQGLSFRFFEAMYYSKKIITDNASVKNYDFYDPANIFITDYVDFTGLDEFMQTPFQNIANAVVEKYGFKNWIRYVLNIQEFESLNLPL